MMVGKTRILAVLSILCVWCGTCWVQAQEAEKAVEEKKNPEVVLETALNYLGDLNLDRAYEWADKAVVDFPKSEEAEKALIIKCMISVIRLECYEMLSRQCAEAIRKGAIYEYKVKNRDLYVETTQKAVDAGEKLVGDINPLFQYVGRGTSFEFKKNYDSLALLKDAYVPYKMLESGYPPTRNEMGLIEKHQSDMSYMFIMSRILNGPSPESDEDVARSLQKKQVIETDMNWAGFMMAVGDWLIHYAPICRVGWIHPVLKTRTRDLDKAKAGYSAARRCFQDVVKLSVDKYDKARVRAEDRISEIDRAVKDLK